MKRLICIDSGIIAGENKEAIENIIAETKGSFTQRKTYFEYYYEPIEVEISLEQLEELSALFEIRINRSEVKIIEDY